MSIKWSLSALVALTALAFTQPKAQADLLLEPYLGYHTGTFNTGFANSSTQSGVTYGARIGYQSMGFMVGADVMSGSWNLAANAITGSTTATPTDLGAFVGYNFPVLIRVYGEYGFSAQDKISSVTVTEKGTNVKFGVGFNVAPFISLNLEYIADTYPKNSVGANSPNATDAMYGLTISVPFTL